MDLRVPSSSTDSVFPEEVDGLSPPPPHLEPETRGEHDSISSHPGAAVGADASFETPISMSDAFGRQMLASSPQACDVSATAKNADRICGGAAVMNALILSSDTDAARRANAAALEKTAKSVDAQKFLPPSVKPAQVDAALKAFRAGDMKPTDVQVLQQLAYATFRGIQSDSQDTGTSVGAMAVMTGELASNGAKLGDTRFSLFGSGSAAHWVTDSHGVVANSMPKGDERATMDRDQAPPIPRSAWEAEVVAPSKHDASVHVSMRGGGQLRRLPDGQAYSFDLDPKAFHTRGAPDLNAAARAIRQGIERSKA